MKRDETARVRLPGARRLGPAGRAGGDARATLDPWPRMVSCTTPIEADIRCLRKRKGAQT
jgi:hypothetical protein